MVLGGEHGPCQSIRKTLSRGHKDRGRIERQGRQNRHVGQVTISACQAIYLDILALERALNTRINHPRSPDQGHRLHPHVRQGRDRRRGQRFLFRQQERNALACCVGRNAQGIREGQPGGEKGFSGRRRYRLSDSRRRFIPILALQPERLQVISL